MISLSVIVPVFNEEELLRSAMQKNLTELGKTSIDYEIILINDGSTDRTPEILQEFLAHPQIRIYTNETNRGFGDAVRKGMNYATKESVMFVPVDSPLTEPMFRAFLDNYHSADILVGYRNSRKGYTFTMKANSYLYIKIISLLFGMNLRDYNWIHLYKREALQKAGIYIESSGVFMLAEVLIKAKKCGLSMVEFPVHHFGRASGIPSAAKTSVILKTGYELGLFLLKELKR